MLTPESLTNLETALPTILDSLKDREWEVNPPKIQGPSVAIKFLGITWLGKTQNIPRAVTDKIAQQPIPQTIKQLHIFLGLLGYWKIFIPYLTQTLRPLHTLVKGMQSGTGHI